MIQFNGRRRQFVPNKKEIVDMKWNRCTLFTFATILKFLLDAMFLLYGPYNRISTSNRNFRVVANVNSVHLFHILSPISFFIRNELSTASIKLVHVWFKQKIDFWLNFEHFLTIIYLLLNEALHILFSPFWLCSTEQQMTAEFLFSDFKNLPCKMTHTRDF